MRRNYETCLVGLKCILVPYRPCHVAKYHEWMKDPKLLEATGSEPLSLEEEYEMQQSWKLDDHKCTFIVLDKSKCTMEESSGDDGENNNFIENNLAAMVGDVNLFLSMEDVDEEDSQRRALQQAELDVMVAEDSAQGKGIGKEASCLMIQYATDVLGVERIFVKINKSNEVSLGLFGQRLGFRLVEFVECFQQYEYELRRTKERNSRDMIDDVLERRDLVSFQCRDASAS